MISAINNIITTNKNISGRFFLLKILYLAKTINDEIHIDRIVNVVDMESIIIYVDTWSSVEVYDDTSKYPVDKIITIIVMCQYFLVNSGRRSRLNIVMITSNIYLLLQILLDLIRMFVILLLLELDPGSPHKPRQIIVRY